MKNIIIGTAALAISFTACNTASYKTDDNKVNTDTTKTQQQFNNTKTKSTASIKELVNAYLQVKNALAGDNGNDAANGGKAILDALAKFDSSSLSAEERKAYYNVADDIKDNAEHISESSDKIAHQRQHFENLSQDVYDLVKAFAEHPVLYKDYCPMYNNGKGATWISEIKEIKNPYLGKKMPACGEVQEDIK